MRRFILFLLLILPTSAQAGMTWLETDRQEMTRAEADRHDVTGIKTGRQGTTRIEIGRHEANNDETEREGWVWIESGRHGMTWIESDRGLGNHRGADVWLQIQDWIDYLLSTQR